MTFALDFKHTSPIWGSFVTTLDFKRNLFKQTCMRDSSIEVRFHFTSALTVFCVLYSITLWGVSRHPFSGVNFDFLPKVWYVKILVFVPPIYPEVDDLTRKITVYSSYFVFNWVRKSCICLKLKLPPLALSGRLFPLVGFSVRTHLLN